MPLNEEMVSAVDIGDSKVISDVDVLTNNELAQTIADLKAALQTFNDKSAAGGLAKLEALANLGISRNSQGQLVVPPGVSILVPGNFEREQVTVTMEAIGVIFKVAPTATS